MEKAKQVISKVKSIFIIYFDFNEDSSQSICTVRPNSQFRTLLWNFTATAWKCAKNSLRTLELRTDYSIMTTRRLTLSFLSKELQSKNNMTAVSHPPYFSVSPTEGITQAPSFWHNWGHRGRIAGGDVHPLKTLLPGCF
jgi:hypothetical protein